MLSRFGVIACAAVLGQDIAKEAQKCFRTRNGQRQGGLKGRLKATMAKRMFQIIVDEEENIVRLLGRRPADQSLANIAAAMMQEIIRGSKSEKNRAKAAEIIRALGVTSVEEIPSN